MILLLWVLTWELTLGLGSNFLDPDSTYWAMILIVLLACGCGAGVGAMLDTAPSTRGNLGFVNCAIYVVTLAMVMASLPRYLAEATQPLLTAPLPVSQTLALLLTVGMPAALLGPPIFAAGQYGYRRWRLR